MLFRTGVEFTGERTQPKVVHGSDRDHGDYQTELPSEGLADRGEPEVAATMERRLEESSETQVCDSGNEEDGDRYPARPPEAQADLLE